MERCRECRFWHFDDLEPKQALTYGECRRFPPVRVQSYEALSPLEESSWPLVEEEEWCGEFSRTTNDASSR